MPTVEELDRITALVARLTPLGNRQAGELIAAEDWNVLVAALIEIGRAILEDRDAPVPPHEHPDQVGVGWLDPRLRSLVEKGSIGDPGPVARVGALELGATRTQAALDGLSSRVDDVRDRAREIAARDVEREASVNVVRRKIEGLADARDDVVDVRASLDSVRDRLTRAVDLAESLQSGGEAVDLGALKSRVDALDDLRSSLTLPSGEVLDGSALDRRIGELRNDLVGRDELDDVLASHRAQLDPDQEAALEGRLQTQFDTELTDRENELRASLAASTDARLAQVDGLVGQRIADSTPAIRDQVLAAAQAQIDARAEDVLAKAAADADTRAKAAADTLGARLDARFDGLAGELPDLVGSQLNRQLPPLVGDLRGNIDSLRGDVDKLTTGLSTTGNDLATLNARIGELQRTTKAGLDSLRADMKTGIDGLGKSLGERVGRLEAGAGSFGDRLTQLESGFDTRVNAAVSASATQLRGEFAGIARDQVAGLEDRLPTLVNARVDTRIVPR